MVEGVPFRSRYAHCVDRVAVRGDNGDVGLFLHAMADVIMWPYLRETKPTNSLRCKVCDKNDRRTYYHVAKVGPICGVCVKRANPYSLNGNEKIRAAVVSRTFWSVHDKNDGVRS